MTQQERDALDAWRWERARALASNANAVARVIWYSIAIDEYRRLVREDVRSEEQSDPASPNGQLMVETMRQLLPLLQGEGWQPIESAPRDWDDVLVFSPEHEGFNCGGVFSAFYDTERKGWFTHGPSQTMRLNPTHWMPLPAFPSKEPCDG